MPYAMRKIEVPSSVLGTGNSIADRLNQFLAFNPTITPVLLSASWKEGRSRSDQLNLTLTYRPQNAVGRYWSAQFDASPSVTAESLASAFFALNATFLPILTVVITPPESLSYSRKLLVIYCTQQMSELGAVLQGAAAAPSASVAVGAYGNTYDSLALSRPAMPTLNLGNVSWPAGGTNLLIRSLDNDPDMDAHAGIAPGCYTGGGISPPAPLDVEQLCDSCISSELVTSTETTTTTTTTTNTGTTTSSTSTTSTSTTSTTSTTTPPSCLSSHPNWADEGTLGGAAFTSIVGTLRFDYADTADCGGVAAGQSGIACTVVDGLSGGRSVVVSGQAGRAVYPNAITVYINGMVQNVFFPSAGPLGCTQVLVSGSVPIPAGPGQEVSVFIESISGNGLDGSFYEVSISP